MQAFFKSVDVTSKNSLQILVRILEIYILRKYVVWRKV